MYFTHAVRPYFSISFTCSMQASIYNIGRCHIKRFYKLRVTVNLYRHLCIIGPMSPKSYNLYWLLQVSTLEHHNLYCLSNDRIVSSRKNLIYRIIRVRHISLRLIIFVFALRCYQINPRYNSIRNPNKMPRIRSILQTSHWHYIHTILSMIRIVTCSSQYHKK